MEKKLITNLHEIIWNQGTLAAVDTIVSEAYTIFKDAGDAWEGLTLDRDTYRKRVLYSRNAFPDLIFKIETMVHEKDLVAVIWKAKGTHLGNLTGLPATGKKLSFEGQTVYKIVDGLVAGHWQTVDRLGFIQQLRG